MSFQLCYAGPLVRIKQALTRLKQEVQQMEVRIGVVSWVLSFVCLPFVSFFSLCTSKTKKMIGKGFQVDLDFVELSMT